MVKTPTQHPTIPPLVNGDKLTRYEFERRYNATSNLKKAELIEGIVYMAAALRFKSHSQPHGWILLWLGTYAAITPKLALGVEPTVRLDLDNEPQPDAVLLVTPEAGGQARLTDDDYIEGAPELVVEIADISESDPSPTPPLQGEGLSGSPFPRREGGWGVRSSHFTNSNITLYTKKQAYRRNGVKEYIVWQVLDRKLSWFNLEQGEYVELSADTDEILRSQVFPGLWLAVAELLAGDMQQVLTVLQAGLQSPEGAAFVNKLSGGCMA